VDNESVAEVRAGDVGEGYRILQSDGTATAAIMAIEWHDEWAVLWLDDGDVWEFPRDRMISAFWHEDGPDVPLHVPAIDAGSPVAGLLEEVVAAHPKDAEIRRLAAQVSRGYANPPGIEGVADLAADLYLRLDDASHAAAVCQLVTGERSTDGWTWIAQALGIAHHLATAAGDPVLRAQCRERLRERVVQHQLDRPILYGDKIAAAMADGYLDSELARRSVEIRKLMTIRATGGSRTFTDDELDVMIADRIAELRRRAVGR
jgi:hypothetical protein